MEKLKTAFSAFSSVQGGIVESLQIIAIAVMIYFMVKILFSNNAATLFWIYLAFTIVMGICLFISDYEYAGVLMLLFQVFFYLGVVVLFSTEIKRTIWQGRFGEHKHGDGTSNFDADGAIEEIIKAIQNMSKNDVGALIILSNGNLPAGVLESGVYLNADISAQLIESIFFPKSALHDGALILKDTRIQAAGCFLPLAQEFNLSKDLGSRHRAGIGLTETVNVTAIIVSEETGIISIAKGGKIIRFVDTNVLRETLKDFYWQDLIR